MYLVLNSLLHTNIFSVLDKNISMFQGISIIEFRKKFQTERDCLAYLLEKKQSKGYQCLHCGHHEYGKGKGWHYRRCKKSH